MVAQGLSPGPDQHVHTLDYNSVRVSRSGAGGLRKASKYCTAVLAAQEITLLSWAHETLRVVVVFLDRFHNFLVGVLSGVWVRVGCERQVSIALLSLRRRKSHF